MPKTLAVFEIQKEVLKLKDELTDIIVNSNNIQTQLRIQNAENYYNNARGIVDNILPSETMSSSTNDMDELQKHLSEYYGTQLQEKIDDYYISGMILVNEYFNSNRRIDQELLQNFKTKEQELQLTLKILVQKQKNIIDEKNSDTNKSISSLNSLIIKLLIIAVLLYVVLAYYFSRTLERDFGIFSIFFKRAASNHSYIDNTHLTADFRKLGNYANSMIDDILQRNKLLEEYRHVIDVTNIVSKVDANGIITYVNDTFCKISGYSREEIIGKSHDILSDPEVSPDFHKQLWATLQSKNIWQGVVRNKRKDGSLYWLMSSIVPILNKEGKIVEFIAIRTDISELINTKNKLREAYSKIEAYDYVKEEFIELTANILKNPLLSIKNDIHSFLMKESEKLSIEDRNVLLLGILYETEKTINLVKSLETAHQLEADTLDFNIEKIDIEKYIQKAMNDFRIFYRNKKVALEYKRGFAPSQYVLACKSNLSKVFGHLLRNALESTLINGKVTISICASQNYPNFLQVSVKDTGVGISSEDQAHIFERMKKTNRAKTYSDIGLGLPMIKTIIEKLGGKIWLESEIGKGSDFVFVLPMS